MKLTKSELFSIFKSEHILRVHIFKLVPFFNSFAVVGWLVVGIRQIVLIWDLGLWGGNALHGGLSKGS